MPTAAADIFSFDIVASCCMGEVAAEVFRVYAHAASAGDEREQEAPRRAPAAAAVTNR